MRMKMFDNHVHQAGIDDDTGAFYDNLRAAGLEGALLLSLPPGAVDGAGRKLPWKERLESVLEFQRAHGEIVPFFHIDPTEDDVSSQIDAAAAAGIAGFKAICIGYDPADSAVLKTWEQISETGRPVTFHCGILIGPAVSEYCRPIRYEKLLQVPGLRFCLAHVGWPWCDEAIGLLAKWNNCRNQGRTTAELYFDATPGAKGYSRTEMFRKLFSCEIDVANRIMYGTDMRTGYDVRTAQSFLGKDHAIFDELEIPEDARERYFSRNMLEYIGRSAVQPSVPTAADADAEKKGR